MLVHSKAFFVILLAFSTISNYSFAQQDYLSTYKQLRKIQLDEARVVNVKSLNIQKDRGNILFEKGKLYFSKPVLGKITHAVFIGEGLFTLTPPDEIEKYQIQRFLKADSIYQEFSAAYFQFTDETFEPFLKDFKFQQQKTPIRANKLSKKINELFLKEQNINLASHVLSDLLNKTSGHFITFFELKKKSNNFPNYLIFSYDATSSETVGIQQFFPHRAEKDFYTVCSFPKTDNSSSINPVRTSSFKISHYDITADIKKNGKISALAEMMITSPTDSIETLYLEIFDEMEIDSVKSEQKKLEFIKEEKESGFSILLPKPISLNSTLKITVFFKGRILEQIQNRYYLKNQLYWYPRKGYLQPATYNLTFTYPKDMQVVATGKKVKEWQIDKKNKSSWQENIPSIAAAFSFGRFKSDSFNFCESGKVTVFSEKSRSKRIRESVAADVASSLFFFEKYLGQLPFDQMLVAETANTASYGYRRTLLMTSLSFQHDIEGVMQALRGHETSHQWWGNVIGWKTYHDQWLSESLAEYSGALINQFLLNDDDYFWDFVDGWRNDFLHHGHIGVSLGMRRFGFSRSDLAKSEGADAGPIWLGQRLGTKNPVDYYLNVYEKGALVIHMLRTMLHDFETKSDERFLLMLTDFVQTYKGQKVTTESFQKIVSKHFGQNMDWFFQQWIYGNKIPTYEYSHETFEDRGRFYVELTIEQKKIAPEFKAEIPVGIKFEKREKQIQLVQMEGNSKSLRLGPFSTRPKEIIFNDYFGVLAYAKKK